MRVYEAPERRDPVDTYTPSLFLAGGITGCPDWQQDLIGLLKDTPLHLFNPRRVNFPIHDPSAAPAQIRWEHDHLRAASAISFWFPCETLNPITLYELGAWSMAKKMIFVGVHPDYRRRQDVEIQTALVRSEVKVVYDLKALAGQIDLWWRMNFCDACLASTTVWAATAGGRVTLTCQNGHRTDPFAKEDKPASDA